MPVVAFLNTAFGWSLYSENRLRGSEGRMLADKMNKKSKRRGVELLSLLPLSRGETYPIGVLVAPAPEPEVSTRITPDWSVKYIFCPVVAAVIGLAVIV